MNDVALRHLTLQRIEAMRREAETRALVNGAARAEAVHEPPLRATGERPVRRLRRGCVALRVRRRAPVAQTSCGTPFDGTACCPEPT